MVKKKSGHFEPTFLFNQGIRPELEDDHQQDDERGEEEQQYQPADYQTKHSTQQADHQPEQSANETQDQPYGANNQANDEFYQCDHMDTLILYLSGDIYVKVIRFQNQPCEG
jgi:hypothetical protein